MELLSVLPRLHGIRNINDHVDLPCLQHGEHIGFSLDQWLVDQAAANPVLGHIPSAVLPPGDVTFLGMKPF